MLKPNGEQALRTFTDQTFQESVEEIVPGVWIACSIGHSNAIFIVGDTSVILVDTLDTGKRGERLRDIIRDTTGKEVKTIIYTHNHVDHRGGARQFGFRLSDEENISQGIGIRTGAAYGEARAFRKPNVVYQEDKVVREIDGITIEMVRIQGETDDQIMVWLPEKSVLCCGQKQVEEVLANFRNAISYVLEETLRGMNEGKDMDTLATEITLPDSYAGLPYLGEYYGTVDWTVRAIFTAYAGWFDGNPTHLHPLPPKEHGEKSVALMEGRGAAEDCPIGDQCEWQALLSGERIRTGRSIIKSRKF